MIAAVAVVVPIHDEAEHLPACIAAIDAALARVAVDHTLVLVLDDCTDGSAAIAFASGADVIEVRHRNVGRARSAGFDRALERFAHVDRARVWLATTDADSRVPPHWLSEQLRLAVLGVEAIAGSVHVDDWTGYPPGFGERFRDFYEGRGQGGSHGHVHGANMGVRADAYLAAGGFAPLETGEDHALWRALEHHSRISSRSLPVITSARKRGRAPHGLSEFLDRF